MQLHPVFKFTLYAVVALLLLVGLTVMALGAEARRDCVTMVQVLEQVKKVTARKDISVEVYLHEDQASKIPFSMIGFRGGIRKRSPSSICSTLSNVC